MFPDNLPPNAKRPSPKKKRANRNAKLKQCNLDARREQWLSLSLSQCKSMDDENGAQIKPMLQNDNSENCVSRDYRENEHEWSGNWNTYRPVSLIGSVLSSFRDSEDQNDNDNDGFLDDWETIADALEANDRQHVESVIGIDSSVVLIGLKPESDITVLGKERKNQAWQPGDSFRPHSLPGLSVRHCLGDFVFAKSVPTSCPICYEELDCTDTSFVPCFCGFRLCLFCHNRILEEDGRCPGCRSVYKKNDVETEGSSFTTLLGRSGSMVARS